ncbi:unnamed protein product, partial [Hapterophycus canaliculatus]
MATLAKPIGAGDTKKVRRMRKKLEGKATGGSISTAALLQQCRDAGVHVKPLLTPHLERHGRQPTLSGKEARQLVLHSASGSAAPKVAEIRNLPAVRAVLVVSLTGAATAAASPAATAGPETDGDEGHKLTVPPSASTNPLDGFTEDFKGRFRLCAGLRISSGGFSADPADGAATASDGVAAGTDAGGGGGWLKSLADAFLYAPLGEDREACPAGPFSSRKKRKTAGGRKKKTKGDAKRRRKAAEAGDEQIAEHNDSEGVIPDADDTDNAGGESSGEEGSDGKSTKQDGEEEMVGGMSSSGGGMDVADSTVEAAATGTPARVEGDEDQSEPHAESRGVVTSDDEEPEGEESDDAPPLPAIETYILTAGQLRENGFPFSRPEQEDGVGAAVRPILEKIAGKIVLPTAEEARGIVDAAPKLIDLKGYVQTQTLLSGTGMSEEGGAAAEGVRVFGLDCEMCMTEAGLELTRVTLVDEKHEVVLDELVKPDNHIVDYVTRYSGITPQLLEKVDTRLHQVQAAILRVVGAEDVLVGHSLENDLKALKMMHLRCLDTALLYPHPKKGRRSSLRYLVSMYLQRTIQTSNKGHNSAEDAIAALELAQLKVSRGPNFGAERSTDSIFDRLHRNRVPSTMVASSEQCRRHVSGAASAVPSFSDDGVVQTVLKELKGADDNQRAGTKPPLVWAELEGPKCPTVQQVCAAANGGLAGIRAFLAGMDKAGRSAGHARRGGRLLDGLPPGGMV